MKECHYKIVEPLAELVDSKIHQLLEFPIARELAAAMQQASAKLPHSFELQLNVSLAAFEPEREAALPLTTQTICSIGGQETYLAQADSSVHRYIADGQICQVPHDRCPRCWDIWEAKFLHDQCVHCGARLGDDVKFLLDADRCPYCERGKVSLAAPKCPECGFEIDPDTVAWG